MLDKQHAFSWDVHVTNWSDGVNKWADVSPVCALSGCTGGWKTSISWALSEHVNHTSDKTTEKEHEIANPQFYVYWLCLSRTMHVHDIGQKVSTSTTMWAWFQTFIQFILNAACSLPPMRMISRRWQDMMNVGASHWTTHLTLCCHLHLWFLLTLWLLLQGSVLSVAPSLLCYYSS